MPGASDAEAGGGGNKVLQYLSQLQGSSIEIQAARDAPPPPAIERQQLARVS